MQEEHTDYLTLPQPVKYEELQREVMSEPLACDGGVRTAAARARLTCRSPTRSELEAGPV